MDDIKILLALILVINLLAFLRSSDTFMITWRRIKRIIYRR
jgi:hypothetical protein